MKQIRIYRREGKIKVVNSGKRMQLHVKGQDDRQMIDRQICVCLFSMIYSYELYNIIIQLLLLKKEIPHGNNHILDDFNSTEFQKSKILWKPKNRVAVIRVQVMKDLQQTSILKCLCKYATISILRNYIFKHYQLL